MEVKGKRVFLSGPMSGFDKLNVGAFADAHMVVKSAGAKSVYNPAIECLNASDFDLKRSHSYWMRRCIEALVTCDNVFGTKDNDAFYDVLVSLPGWEDSDGARIEREVAEACGIECCDLSEVE